MKRIIIHFHVLVLLSLSLSAVAQLSPEEEAMVDSLKSVISTAKHDTIVVQALKAWDDIIYISDPDLDYALNQKIDSVSTLNLQKSLSEKERISFLKSKAFALNNIGTIYRYQGDYSESIDYHGQSLKIYEEIDDKRGLAAVLGNIGSIQYLQGDFVQAIEYQNRSLSMHEDVGNKQGMSAAFNNLGAVYKDQGAYKKAIEQYTKSLKIDEELGRKQGAATSLGNIGIIYKELGNFNKALDYYTQSQTLYQEVGDKQGVAISLHSIGNLYYDQKEYDQAVDYYNQSLEIYAEIGDKLGVAISLSSLGSIFHEQGEAATHAGDIDLSAEKYSEAIDYYNQSQKIQEEIGDKRGIAVSLNNIARIHKARGDFAKALDYSLQSLSIAEEVGLAIEIKAAAHTLWRTYKAMENHEEALMMYELFVAKRDSLVSVENQQEVIRQEFQYTYDKKEALARAEQEKKDAVAAQVLKRQKLVRNGFMGGFAVVLVFAGVFLAQRNRIGREKKNSEELLLNILPAKVADELKAKGTSDARLMDSVTVLFTDFKGFTQLSEILTPQDLVKDLHECFSAFDHILEKYGIEKIKTIGDAYMAAGGLPTTNTTHATDVVKAALEMRGVIEKGKAKKIAAGLPYFEIRIGIHTGPVVAGIVGVKKFQYDIWGDTVNTASRMESSGEVGKVNISDSTYRLVKDNADFSFVYRGKVAAKGKGEIDMYFVELS